MRIGTSVLLFVIFAIHARAADVASYVVEVDQPRVIRVIPPARLPALCGPEANACTHIVGAELRGRCEADSDAWRVVGRVHFLPLVYVPADKWRGALFTHELAHILDIERGVERRIRALARTRFSSRAECDARLDLEEHGLDDYLRELAGESFGERR